MSRTDSENPPYYSVVKLHGAYRLNRYDYSRLDDTYLITGGLTLDAVTELEAQTEARRLAANEGLEVR